MVRDIYKGEQTQSVGEEVIPVQFAISANSTREGRCVVFRQEQGGESGDEPNKFCVDPCARFH
jgi:hypothetical protein